ncbi:uncharacterized protein LOC116145276 [Pistacia vera]|uniref:uncharacterized protein LOC116145276 n=1 Tax=Pistacia vera TaxID=55513 RepID=UPI0012632C6A|nr:uncharacterized protein LOC116145276 [Pistacia vera]
MSLLPKVRGFIFLFCKSARPSTIKPFTACLYKPFRRYGQGSRLRDDRHEMDEKRAPSIAEVFERVAEEKQKLRAAEQGVASQTSDKLYDGAEEATIGKSKVEPVKKKFEEPEEGADYRRTGDEA